MAPRSIIIDTDPGQDDAVAIMLALAFPEAIEVIGITAVAGNVPLAKTSTNALKLLELVGRTDVPVFAGAVAPLMVPLETAEYVHGESGLNGWTFPDPVTPLQTTFGPDFIIEAVMSRPEKTVTLCPLGPLTNVALALAKEPRLAARLEEIVLMGGAKDAPGWVLAFIVLNGILMHWNVALRFGPLERCIITPAYHRIHHSIEERHYDRNFGVFTQLWDHVFGTRYVPRPGEYPEAGITQLPHLRAWALLAPWPLVWLDRRPSDSPPGSEPATMEPAKKG